MTRYRGFDAEPGWINRDLRELRKEIAKGRTSERLQSATVGHVSVPPGAVVDATGDGAVRSSDADKAAELSSGRVRATRTVAGFDGNPDSVTVRVDDSGHGEVAASGDVVLAPATGVVRVSTIATAATTSSTANAVIDAVTGELRRSTSSRRYKCDIADAQIDTAAVLAVQIRRFRRVDEVARMGDAAPSYVGVVAEEVAALGLHDWLDSDENGPESFAYASWAIALQAVCQDLSAKVTALQQQVASLEARLPKV